MENTQIAENGQAVTLPSNLDFDLIVSQSDSKALKKAEKGITLTRKYYEFQKPGDTLRGIFINVGYVTVKDQQNNNELKEIPSVNIMVDGKVITNAGANLVGQFQDGIVQPGQAVEIEYVEKKENVKIYEVSLLK